MENISEMSKDDIISFIIKSELKIMEAFNNGHKPHSEDEYQPLRKQIDDLRKQIGLK